MDPSVLTSSGSVLAAALGAALALVLVTSFMLVWRLRSPRVETRLAAATPHRHFEPSRADALAVDHHHSTASPSEDTPMGSETSGTFATVVNCIDGRAQGPVSDWIKINCQASFVDTITTPGPDKLLSSGPHSKVDHVHEAIEISVTKHHSRAVIVAGHYDCAANPVSDDEHKRQIHAALDVARSWSLPVRIVGLWVNEWWQVEVIVDEPARVAS
jgi:hypothetical protein